MPIEVRNLSHIYMRGTPMENKALEDICMKVEDGEFIGIIGHTGSGKSTLISHLNALERSEKGCVFVNGMDLGEKGTKLSEVRRTVGLVFQYPEYQLFEETVEKDIAFGPNNLKLPAEEVSRRVTEAMALVGLDEKYKTASPFNLSGGQKRRVAIAGVLAMNPSILILDEPAAGLDPAGRRTMLELIRGIHLSGVTIIMVSHSMDDVGKYCDRLYVLNKGKVAFEGKPAEVFSHGRELREIGLDVPECAHLAAVLRERGFKIDESAYSIEDVAGEILKNLHRDGGEKC